MSFGINDPASHRSLASIPVLPLPSTQLGSVRTKVARRSPIRYHAAPLVLIGSPPKWAVLSCPCGTDHKIDLNLGNVGTTRWSIRQTEPPSVHPSIDVQNSARRCHFWLRDGRVQWAR
ncbi:MAG: DUF6527 family protein [Acidimicrobiales bacterium]